MLGFEEHYVRDMIFINYVLAFIACFTLLLRLFLTSFTDVVTNTVELVFFDHCL